MLFCPRCGKEVIVVGLSPGPEAEKFADQIREAARREGKLVLFNPSPFGTPSCPVCFTGLVDVDAP
ncbi:MAG: hypothetical protein Kow0069_23650 [Promethearchaeota archaeon]